MLNSKPLNTLLLLLFSFSLSWQSIGAQKHTWQEAFKVLGISWNSNGTLNRQIQIPMVDAQSSGDAKPTPTALSTDIYLSSSSKAYVRVYIPLNPPKDKKLPLIIYFHGGDFVLFSASTVIFHNFCNDIASKLPAVVVSVEYRLAPENRIPAAYDDALNAIFWARDQAKGTGYGRDPWMEYADFSKVYLLGSSAGANIAYHVALRALDFDIKPLKIVGLLMNQAYFGGLQRTQSEIRLINDPYVALYVNDVLWTLALPRNLNRDHEFCNPISGGTYLGRVYKLPKVYIKGDYGDPLVDRSVYLAQYLYSLRASVYYRFNQGGYHGIELSNKTAAQALYDDIKYFVYNLGASENTLSDEPMYVDMKNVDRSVQSSGKSYASV